MTTPARQSVQPAVGLFFLFYLLAFSLPVLVLPFAHHDQYRYFAQDPSQKIFCQMDPQFETLRTADIRPVMAYIECAVFRRVGSLADLPRYRTITVFFAAAAAYLLYVWLVRCAGVGPELAIGFSLGVLTLPGIQNFVVMGNIPAQIAVVVGFAAVLILDLSPVPAPVRFGAVVCLLIFGFLNYPMGTYVFLIPTAFAIFLAGRKEAGDPWRRGVRDLSVLAAASALFLVGGRMFQRRMGYYAGGGGYQLDLLPNLIGRLHFLSDCTVFAANFWNIYSNRAIGWLLLIFLILSFGIPAGRRAAAARERRILRIRLLAIPALLLASMLPALLSNMGEPVHRFLIAYSGVILVIFLWRVRDVLSAYRRRAWVRGIERYQRWVLGAFLLLVGISVAMNAYFTAQNSRAELAYTVSRLKAQVRDPAVVQVRNVNRSLASRSFIGLPPVSDEFNVNTTVYNMGDIQGLIRLALLSFVPGARVRACDTVEQCRAEQGSDPGEFHVIKSERMIPGEDTVRVDYLPYTLKQTDYQATFAASGGRSYRLDGDGSLWLVPSSGNEPVPVDSRIQQFAGASPPLVLGFDGKLWLEEADWATRGRQLLDSGVRYFFPRPRTEGEAFVLKSDGSLWLDVWNPGKSPYEILEKIPLQSAVERFGTFPDDPDNLGVLKSGGELDAVSLGARRANSAPVDGQVRAFALARRGHFYVLGTDGKLWYETQDWPREGRSLVAQGVVAVWPLVGTTDIVYLGGNGELDLRSEGGRGDVHPIDWGVEAFLPAAVAGKIYVLGTDGKLWLEPPSWRETGRLGVDNDRTGRAVTSSGGVGWLRSLASALSP